MIELVDTLEKISFRKLISKINEAKYYLYNSIITLNPQDISNDFIHDIYRYYFNKYSEVDLARERLREFLYNLNNEINDQDKPTFTKKDLRFYSIELDYCFAKIDCDLVIVNNSINEKIFKFVNRNLDHSVFGEEGPFNFLKYFMMDLENE